jgi:hypothetical protein
LQSAAPATESRGNGKSAGAYGDSGAAASPPSPAFNLEGLIRDERGIRMAPEGED